MIVSELTTLQQVRSLKCGAGATEMTDNHGLGQPLAGCSRTDSEGAMAGRRRPREPEVERPRAGGRAAGLAHELAADDSGLVSRDGDRRVDGTAAGRQVDAREPCPCPAHLLSTRGSI